MEIRPIRTDKDHRVALAEIEKLWGASNGTPEGDKLDILVTLVETYEERRWPVRSRRIAGFPFAVRSQHLTSLRRLVAPPAASQRGRRPPRTDPPQQVRPDSRSGRPDRAARARKLRRLA
jgi:hypothetical protein